MYVGSSKEVFRTLVVGKASPINLFVIYSVGFSKSLWLDTAFKYTWKWTNEWSLQQSVIDPNLGKVR